jgi:hypothetical protein
MNFNIFYVSDKSGKCSEMFLLRRIINEKNSMKKGDTVETIRDDY